MIRIYKNDSWAKKFLARSGFLALFNCLRTGLKAYWEVMMIMRAIVLPIVAIAGLITLLDF
jgi:hypothetical protein